jgi:hypothetical protein
MTADGGWLTELLGRRERPKPVCRVDRGGPRGSDDGNSKQIRQKRFKSVKACRLE